MTQPPSDDAPPRDLSPPTVADDEATDPALALADVWELLDVLPSAAASSDMMASTIEMAAVTAGGMTSRPAAGTPTGRTGHTQTGHTPTGQALRQWLPGAALVLASLVAGIALGRATAPTPESAILANLPVVQHLDLLREAGSVAFLEAVAKGGYPPPRRPPPAQSQADVREDAKEFDAAIASLRAAGGTNPNREMLAARREQVTQMPDAQRRQLERSFETFQRLSSADRSEVMAVGRALADPDREQLLKAARLWHAWVQFRDPADRRDVIELSGDDRLEWLDRWTRIDARQEQRPDARESIRAFFERERDNRRRPPPEFQQGPPEFRGGPPPDRRPGPPGMRREDRPHGPPGPPGTFGPPGKYGPPGPYGPSDGPHGPAGPHGPEPGSGPPVSDPEPTLPEENREPPR